MYRYLIAHSLIFFTLFVPASGIAATNVVDASTRACRIADFPQEVQCGDIERPLDPQHPDGKKITIHFVVVPSQDRNKLPDAVFLLAGGPGQSAVSVAGWGKLILGRLNRRRDLVFVDQRGTGLSAPLECPRSSDQAFGGEDEIALAKACLAKLQALPYGDLRFFSSSIAVQDLEAIRVLRHYQTINLVGVSYGTRVGLEYLRQYPHAVKRLVLDGVEPPEKGIPGLGDAQKSLDTLFLDCAKQAACNTSYPKLAQRWQQLLASTPKRVTVTHPRLGLPVTFTLTRQALLGVVFKALYLPTYSAALPYALLQAEQNNFNPLFALSGSGNAPSTADVAMGMHFSVMCGETFGEDKNMSMVFPDDEFSKKMGNMYQGICAEWPRASIPSAFYSVPRSPVPVLLLSGGIDPVTPTRHAAAVTKSLGSMARHIHVDYAGHGLLTLGCVSDVAYRFLNAKDDQAAINVEASCVRQIPRPLAWQAPKNDAVNEGSQP